MGREVYVINKVIVYALVFVSIEKIYQTLETVFHRLSKHLEFGQKYSAVRRIFNSRLGVWISRWNKVARVWYITSATFADEKNKEVEYLRELI